MRYCILFWALLLTIQTTAQTAFEEDFESQNEGLDLTTIGYQLAQNSSYEGNLSITIVEENNNKFARLQGSPSGPARMQLIKAIDVESGKLYRFSMRTRGPFKRHLRIYGADRELLAASADYKPTIESENTEWKTLELSFLAPEQSSTIEIGIFHHWSGIIDLDQLEVLETSRQHKYYISSSSGNDENPGTIDAPFKSLDKISSITLLPGDTVLFKRNEQFNGHFAVNGSGNSENPILITAYGEGELPILSGQVGAENGGDYQEAILVENQDHLIFDGLEVHNERLVSRNGVNDTDAYGIYVYNSGTEVMRNFVFRNMEFKDVFAVEPILDPDAFNSIQVSGLRFFSTNNNEAGKEKHIRDILVEDSYFANLQRFGIQFKHGGGAAGIGNDSINRNMNIICRNNEFYYNGGTSILPNRTYNCLIENNIFDHPGASTDPRMPGRGSSVWNIYAINTVVQYNMCLSTRGYLDSHGIHIDHSNENTFIQYNYMEDCEGGFVEILRGNTNAVYRFNVSVNDGWRAHPTWEDSNHTIWIFSSRWTPEEFDLCDSIYVYNNTVIINKPFTTSINLDGKNMFVYNNIFSSTNDAGMGAQGSIVRANDTPFFMSNNLFEGTVDQDWVNMDADPQIAPVLFSGTGESLDDYQLQPNSPAINNGANLQGPIVAGAGVGVFANIPAYPTVDFYGNPIDLANGSPNIGASNNKNDITKVTNNQAHQMGWLAFPNAAESTIQIINKGGLSGKINISCSNLKGQLIQTEQRQVLQSNEVFDIKLLPSLSNGIYILIIENQGAIQSRRIVFFR